jgi:peptide deformylase
MNLKILSDKDPVLRTPCLPVVPSEHIAFATSMYFTMKSLKAVGLAANQVGKSLRIITISSPQFEGAMFNPIIVSRVEETFDFLEGCLSLKGKKTNTKTRSKSIRVQWQDKSGTYNEQDFEYLSAVIIQHEIDHLDGKLMIDYETN